LIFENSTWRRTPSRIYLYGGDDAYRLCQEAILGSAGVRFLRALGYQNIFRFHMNEGHSALLTLALLEEEIGRQNLTKISVVDLERVREKCVFTTHTPVPAAFDQFSLELTTRILGADRVRTLVDTQCCFAGMLNMTYLALYQRCRHASWRSIANHVSQLSDPLHHQRRLRRDLDFRSISRTL
jgi:glycogen phosphorylase